MNREEKLAFNYFNEIGFKSIRFEPDGNIPPDFLLDDTIAVEVRRLNINVKKAGKTEPIEKLENRIVPIIKSIAENLCFSHLTDSCFFIIKFNIDLSINKNLKSKILKVFKEHLEYIKYHKEYQIDEYLEIVFYPSPKKLQNTFELGMVVNYDNSIFIVGTVYDNIQFAINEKEEKVQSLRKNYCKWWLVLINNIQDLTDYDMNQFRMLAPISHNFEKVIIISHFNNKHTFEL